MFFLCSRVIVPLKHPMKNNFDVKILNVNNIVDFIVLNKDNFYTIKVNGEKYNYLLYCTEVCDNTYFIWNAYECFSMAKFNEKI